MTLEERYEQQHRNKKNIRCAEDVPKVWLDWSVEERRIVEWKHTGRFVKVQLGTNNRRIANRNRASLYSYQPEYEYKGNTFPLSILMLTQNPSEVAT
jgi:hypothetical protein